MTSSEEVVEDIYLHDVKSGKMVLETAVGSEVDFGPSEDEEVEKLEFFQSLVDNVYEDIEQEGIRSGEGVYGTLACFEGYFDGWVGDTVDRISNCSAIVSEYLDEAGEESVVTVSELGERLSQYGAEVEYEASSEVEIEADRGLAMAFNTLGVNQEEHTSEGTDWYAEFNVEEDELRVEVCDNGTGLESYAGEEIFQKGVGDGSGKGLYLARRLIEVNDGSIGYSPDISNEGGFGLEIEVPLSTEHRTLSREETSSEVR
ncbi:MAG: sensor histidine kinase [Candidatus Nanohalobium sp.]